MKIASAKFPHHTLKGVASPTVIPA
jgi:hypothetical protein